MRNILATIILSAVTFSAFADEYKNYSYRRVAIGDTLEHAYIESLNNFETAEIRTSYNSIGPVIAGDSAGMRDIINCPYLAPAIRRIDCHRVSYAIGPHEGKQQVTFISVTQSFSTPLPYDAFMSRIKDSYGKPRSEHLNKIDNDLAHILKDQTLVWGGKNEAPRNFSPSSYPFGDSELLGGKHLVIRIASDSRGVIGYLLRISDHDLSLKLQEERRIRYEKSIEEERSKNINALKFQ